MTYCEHILHLAHKKNYRHKIYFSSGRMTKSKWMYKYKTETIFVAIQDRKIVGTISLKERNSSIERNSVAVFPVYQHNGTDIKQAIYHFLSFFKNQNI